jgi:hypothetical protein
VEGAVFQQARAVYVPVCDEFPSPAGDVLKLPVFVVQSFSRSERFSPVCCTHAVLPDPLHPLLKSLEVREPEAANGTVHEGLPPMPLTPGQGPDDGPHV